ISAASMRANRSAVPPGAKATTILTGLAGQSCARDACSPMHNRIAIVRQSLVASITAGIKADVRFIGIVESSRGSLFPDSLQGCDLPINPRSRRMTPHPFRQILHRVPQPELGLPAKRFLRPREFGVMIPVRQ